MTRKLPLWAVPLRFVVPYLPERLSKRLTMMLLAKMATPLPEHSDALRLSVAGDAYVAFANLEEARRHPDVALVLQGDCGGTIYLTVPVAKVLCDQAVLVQLLVDIDSLCWDFEDSASMYFENLPVGSGVAGGMGGGRVDEDVWIHPEVAAIGADFCREVEDVIHGKRPRIETAGRKWP